MTTTTRLAVAIYRQLVKALPRAAREGFEDELVETFAAAVKEPPGHLSRRRVIASSYVDLLRCMGLEWWTVLKSRAASFGCRRSKKRRREEKTMSSIVQDARYACRQFASRPGFVAVVVLVLGLGIGATTAVFSVVNGVPLKPLPYEEADRLVLLWGHMGATDVTKAPWSGPDLLDFRARALIRRARS